ncbi:NAD(P)-binding protein [Mycena kentingensis (nom. inval.)]|nr:NAD(P)-binding protein [Mycena kentingensis (nom. inval.)]
MTITTSLTTPLVAIVGITGKQGGSVARALIQSDQQYRIRGITRDVSKPAAKVFAEQGVELVQASLTVGNEEAAKQAFVGADIVFGVTNFPEHLDAGREIAEGKLIVDAVKSACPSLKLFVWSGIQSITELSGGRLQDANFFDSKAAVTAYARASGVPLAVVSPGYYMTNIFNAVSSALVAKGDGAYTFGFPMATTTRLPFADIPGDYGLYVRAAIERPEFGAGSELRAGTMCDLGEAMRELSEVSGKNITYEPISVDRFLATFPFKPLAPGLSHMYQSFEVNGFHGRKEPTEPALLGRKPKSWKEYLEGLGRDEVVKMLGLESK